MRRTLWRSPPGAASLPRMPALGLGSAAGSGAGLVARSGSTVLAAGARRVGWHGMACPLAIRTSRRRCTPGCTHSMHRVFFPTLCHTPHARDVGSSPRTRALHPAGQSPVHQKASCAGAWVGAAGGPQTGCPAARRPPGPPGQSRRGAAALPQRAISLVRAARPLPPDRVGRDPVGGGDAAVAVRHAVHAHRLLIPGTASQDPFRVPRPFHACRRWGGVGGGVGVGLGQHLPGRRGASSGMSRQRMAAPFSYVTPSMHTGSYTNSSGKSPRAPQATSGCGVFSTHPGPASGGAVPGASKGLLRRRLGGRCGCCWWSANRMPSSAPTARAARAVTASSSSITTTRDFLIRAARPLPPDRVGRDPVSGGDAAVAVRHAVHAHRLLNPGTASQDPYRVRRPFHACRRWAWQWDRGWRRAWAAPPWPPGRVVRDVAAFHGRSVFVRHAVDAHRVVHIVLLGGRLLCAHT